MQDGKQASPAAAGDRESDSAHHAALQRLLEFSLSADFLRRLIEESHRVFFVFSPDGAQTYYVSPSFDDIWQRPRSLLYADPGFWNETIHPDDRERTLALVAGYLREPATAHPPLEYRIVLPQGGVRWLWGYVFTCDDKHGRPNLLCGIAEDVTEAKVAAEARESTKAALEETVRKRTLELTELNDMLRNEIAQRKETEETLYRQKEYLKKLIYAQDLERKFISYDIHDGAIQSVIAARMHLEAGIRKLHAERNGAPDLEEAQRLLAGVLEETRRIIGGIRPPTLDDLGVAAAIEEQAEENAKQGLHVEFHDETGRRRWSPTLEMTIYRIVQESLSNVRRHGQTEHARVELSMRGDQIVVAVSDRGQGFDVSRVADREFGLRGIRDRAAAVGGQVSITSELGKGTTVTAILPSLDPEEAATVQKARAERALQISRSRLESILDSTPAVVFIKDNAGRYEFINRRYADLFHVDRNDFIGCTDHEIFPVEVADKLRTNDIQVLAQSEPLTIEESVPSNGQMREYVSVKFSIPGEEGAGPSVCGIATDITERKHELLALRDSQNRFCSFMDHLPMLAWIKDAEGRYVYANRCLLEVHHFEADNVLGKTDYDIFPQEVAAVLRDHDQIVLRTGEPQHYLETAPAGGGPQMAWESFKFPLTAGDGSQLVGGVAFDVTRHYAQQSEAKRSEKTK